MVGSGESVQKLGLIPCAISWLYAAIERRREKTWTDLTVSVSAVELCCGEEDTLRDLLGEVAPPLGSIHDSPKAHIRIQEDPVYGIQVEEEEGGRVKAPPTEAPAIAVFRSCFTGVSRNLVLHEDLLSPYSCGTTTG